MFRYGSVLIALFLSLAYSGYSQILTPVSWETSWDKLDESTYELRFKASIDEGWYIYSQHIEEGGPIPTSFFFSDPDALEFLTEMEESGPERKEGLDPVFDMQVIKYAREVTFSQRVKVNDPSQPIEGYLEFMTCDDSRCLPPTEEDFAFILETGEMDLSPSGIGAVTLGESRGGLENPTRWEGRLQRLNENDFQLDLKVRLEPSWYTYSQFLEEDGPIPTSIHIDAAEGLELLGEPQESGPHRIEEHDSFFDMDLVKFKEEAVFSRRFRLADPQQSLTGYLEFMVCNETKCLPPDEVTFRIDPAELTVTLGEEQAAAWPPSGQTPGSSEGMYAMEKPDLNNPVLVSGEAETVKEESGMAEIFGLGFIGGLLALLTPCVFPLIPLTVSFFSKNDEKEEGLSPLVKSSLYGFFILLVYLLFSLPFHLMDSINPDILNDLSTNVWLNVGFFAIFVFFAFSFFGYYELTLPSSWVNRVSSAEGVGGLLGIFFMALTLALVSFSCTGPILGSLLAGALSASGGAMQLTAGMAGFGLALALPFSLFAAFPSWLNKLPRSGSWLNTVKVVLGFLELALALKFLSNADLVKHWGILKVEVFLGLWILIFLGLSLYLFRFLRFPHDTPPKKLSPVRIGLGALSLAFVLYLASGFIYQKETRSYRPLTLLSGLAPPSGYSILFPNDCPQNLNCYKDLNTGLAQARKEGKPVMLDFTGYACVNCRKMEEHVWPEKQVFNLLNDDYVLISLYVDDKKELPESEQIWVEKTSGGQRKLRTYGQKWAHFQTEYFRANAQPFYALVAPSGRLLTHPVGYMPDADNYAAFLKRGLKAYETVQQESPLMGEIR